MNIMIINVTGFFKADGSVLAEYTHEGITLTQRICVPIVDGAYLQGAALQEYLQQFASPAVFERIAAVASADSSMFPPDVSDPTATLSPAELAMQQAKKLRAEAVSNIVVTTASGKRFDGNEDAQNRMSRAINGANEGETTPWVLADNSIATVDVAELKEALRLAGLAQTSLWVAPYEG